MTLSKDDLDYLDKLKIKLNPFCESVSDCDKCPFTHELSEYLCAIDAINVLQWTLEPHINDT